MGSTLRQARAEAPAQGKPSLDPLTLFVPNTPKSSWANLARAMETTLTAGMIAPSSLVYDPDGAVAGMNRFLRDYRHDDNVLMVSGISMLSAALLAHPPISLTGITPIARLTSEAMVLASRSHSLSQILQMLRKDPYNVSFTGSTYGSADHIVAALLVRKAGHPASRMKYTPFPAGQGATQAIKEGTADCLVASLSEVQTYLLSGQLRPLAISTPQRLPGVNIPTFMEQGLDFQFSNWRGVFAPAQLRPDRNERLLRQMNLMVSQPSWRVSLIRYNWNSDYLAGPAFGAFVRQESERLRSLLADARL